MPGAAPHFRSEARRATRLEAAVKGASERKPRAAQVVDLSLSGACVELEVAPPVGSHLTLEVWLPNLWAPVRLEGSVKWRKTGAPARMGVRFKVPSELTCLGLLDFLNLERAHHG